MAEGEQNQEERQLSPETLALAEKGRQGVQAPEVDHLATQQTQQEQKPARPDSIPEKFWDAEKGQPRTEELLKAYTELEKKLGAPKETPAPEGEGETEEQKGLKIKKEAEAAAEEEGTEETQANPAEAMTAAITAAQEVYAETGELPQEAIDGLVAAGIPKEAVAIYIEGVKALELALQASAYEAAGSEKDFKDATAWAAKNWSEEEILAFNAQVGNAKLVKTAVKGLMASFREAVPSEGKLINEKGGADLGDVYSSKEEFLKDLAAANASGDAVARQKAVAKLDRSKKAGTVKEVTPRSGPFVN